MRLKYAKARRSANSDWSRYPYWRANMFNVINVDLDGVLYPWHEIVAKEWGRDVREFESWNIHEHLEVSEEVFNRWHEQQQRLGLWNRDDAKVPVEGLRALEYYSILGYRIRILTHRLSKNVPHSKVASDTVQWLDNNEVPYWEIAFVGKDANKGLYLADLAIDDKPQNVHDMTKAGIKSMVLKRPWNWGEIGKIQLDGAVLNFGEWRDFSSMVKRHKDGLAIDDVVKTEEPQEIS